MKSTHKAQGHPSIEVPKAATIPPMPASLYSVFYDGNDALVRKLYPLANDAQLVVAALIGHDHPSTTRLVVIGSGAASFAEEQSARQNSLEVVAVKPSPETLDEMLALNERGLRIAGRFSWLQLVINRHIKSQAKDTAETCDDLVEADVPQANLVFLPWQHSRAVCPHGPRVPVFARHR